IYLVQLFPCLLIFLLKSLSNMILTRCIYLIQINDLNIHNQNATPHDKQQLTNQNEDVLITQAHHLHESHQAQSLKNTNLSFLHYAFASQSQMFSYGQKRPNEVNEVDLLLI